MTVGNEDVKTVFYAVQSGNEALRQRSTSGGFVSMAAEKVITDGGKVFAVVYDDTMMPVHSCIDELDGIRKMCGSKYVQSGMGDTFRKIHEALGSGTQVMFVGTPCQTAGLLSYLEAKHAQRSRLLAVELKCYGVPSPGLFRKYTDFLEKKYGGKLTDMNFRDKSFGYNSTTVSAQFDNGKSISNEYSVKSYSKTFFSGLNIRPSCYNCRFRDYRKSGADIVVGDFHKIGEYVRSMDDDMGTSFAAALTEKGRAAVESAASLGTVRKIENFEEPVPGNPKRPEKRDGFFRDSRCMEWDALTEKYCPVSAWDKAASSIKPMIKKLPGGKGVFRMIKRINDLKYRLRTK